MNQRLDRLLIQGFSYDALICKPVLELNGAIGIRQSSQLICPLRGVVLVLQIAFNGVLHQYRIDHDAAIVDLLIQHIKLLLSSRDWIVLQHFTDLALCVNVAYTVRFETLPLFRSIAWKVASPAAVHLSRLTRKREILDKITAFFELLELDVQHFTYTVQG